MSDRTRGRAFLALCVARFRETYREPEVLFWAFVFPVLLAAALAVAFRDRGPEPSRALVLRGPGAGRLLSGRWGILDEFEASLDEPLEEGVLRIRLVPRHEQADVQLAFLDVEPSGRLRSILLEDLQGNRTRFRFEGLRENTGLPDKLFRFEVPAGVEVVRG